MAALSGSFKSSQIKITYTLINLIFLSHLVLAQSQADVEVSLLDRHRRAVVVLAPVAAPNVVPENVASTVTLYDLTNIAPNRNYVVINDSAGDPSLFQVASSKLTITPNLPADKRRLFDYEKFKTFDVVINAINQTNSADVLVVTIRLQLSDINDEPPTFTSKPVPFLATLPQRPTPGTVVFTVTVEDPDTNPDISFTIDQVTLGDGSAVAGRFVFNELTGGTPNKKMYNIITVGNDPFQQDAEYTIRITAQDKNSILQPSQTTDRIVVRIGLRAPQFLEQSYRGRMYENTVINSWVLEENSNNKLGIQVKQFQSGNALTFQISQNAFFDLQAEGDIQRVVNKQKIDYEATQSVSFTVTVVEAVTGLTSSVQVLVLILDENDNSPVFFAPQYNTAVREDLPINSTVIVVTASDADSGVNGEIVFSVLNTTYFDVLTSNIGKLYYGTVVVKRALDYDVQIPVESFYVVATDKGVTNVMSSRVQVIVTLQNVNDNAPTIVNTSTTIYLNETSAIGSIVTVILASDRDGDTVKFYFEGKTEFSEIFRIRENNGQVLLNSDIPTEKSQFLLKVIAVDDDSCCTIKTQDRTATATFTVNIVGINLNKPTFLTCSQYDKSASVKEKAPNGTFVIQVVATDPDRGENGIVLYDIQTPGPNSPQGVFQIDRLTGNITVKGLIIRDASGYLQVTVKAHNPPQYPLLESRCSFRVNVIDINDHAPTFSESQLIVQVSIATPVSSIIYQMAATDADVGPNASITYSFGAISSAANSTFSINPYTGLIRLDKRLDTSSVNSYILIVIANDNGVDPAPLTGTATVTVIVSADTCQPPEWVPAQTAVLSYNVSESEGYGYVITTLTCKSNTDQAAVEFLVFDAGSTITTTSKKFMAQSYIENGVSKMDLTLRSPLDYETQKLYKVSIICQSFGAVVLRSPLLTPTINVIDANDEIPEFVGLDPVTGRYIGSVFENSPIGSSLLQLTVTDRDDSPKFNQVAFALVGVNSDLFTITNSGNNTALVVTARVFDRENISHYLLMVEARDGAPASPLTITSSPNIASRYIDAYIIDVNDNPPSFNQSLYIYTVKENSPIGFLVAVAKAYDPDEVDQGVGLAYRFIDGNVGNAFIVYSGTGNIEVAKVLDYEAGPREYNLTLMALDQNQLHNATTIIRIEITDENDNYPVFTQNPYIVRNVVTENDTSVTPQNPKYLVTVTATDADVNRPETAIRYYIYSDSQSTVNPLFTVNEITGQVYLIGPLDRDVAPYYTAVTVEAQDERINPLSNYTDVIVYPIDINDNAPVFDPNSLQGSVNEHAANVYFMTLAATDKDEGNNGLVAFRAATVQPNATLSAMFIVKGNGDISTANNVTLLDRELLSQVLLAVEAYDNGTVPMVTTAIATITVLDINDQSPYFDFPFYSVTVSEHHELAEIVSISANDKDTDPKNRQLSFTLEGNPNRTKFFSLQSIGMRAVISLAQPIDYEKDPHVMNFTLTVTDGATDHANKTTLQIIVLDYNDNAPEFIIPRKSVDLVEEEPPGKQIANFTAIDKDSGINSEIEYSIVRASDPRFEFYVDPNNGTVTTRKRLDREVAESMIIYILATDHGEIPLTGTATLSVTLIDINDNPPRFASDYRPVVQENTDNPNTEVQVIHAYDPDTLAHGPPFGFKLPTPCSEPACNFFTLTVDASGDNGNGTATVRTSSRFDREATKYYYLPIVMWDMGGTAGSLTATNTLTITIGDENDNRMQPGNQNILIYNYEGQFLDPEIGRVYANDPDDWDLPDKTFTYISPDNLKRYFSINPQTGMITLNPGLVPNDGKAPYQFSVNVYDKKFEQTVTCTVSVTLQIITDESVRKSGGVRIRGITAEEFVKPTQSVPPTSKYQQFRQAVSSMLGYPSLENVQIVSLTDGVGFLDVRFSSHGSPYVNPSQGESAIMLNLAQFEEALGVKVIQVPINLCMEETSDVGCYNYFNVTGNPELVNANGTSYVMIKTSLMPEDGCVDGMFPDPVECQGDYCFNGGTCIQDDWGKLSCACLDGFDGPRCQQRRHNFDGKSAAFYQGLSTCASGRTSIDFITLQPDGLIMYSGPVTAINLNQDVHDYLILELKGGYPSLRLNLGGAEVALQMTGMSSSNVLVMNKLNDGQWHHVDIDRENQKVTMTIDHCKNAVSTNGTSVDWSPCRIAGRVPGGDVLLNVQSLLQLGGRYPITNVPSYPAGISTTGFNGCLKNLVHNSKLYDLYYKVLPTWNSGANGCLKEETICGDSTGQPVCGQNGTCESRWQPDQTSCRCKPGWHGDKCAIEAPAENLQQNSFFKWQLKQNLVDASKRTGSFQLMYRTRKPTGTLFVLTAATLETIVLYFENGTLTLKYDMGQGETKLQLKNTVANSGQWTTVRIERYGNEFLLKMDGGEGRNYNYQQINTKLGILFDVQPQVTVGAVVNSANQPTEILKSTCIRDVRFNDNWLPLSTDQNNEPDAGGTLITAQLIQDGCVREDCPPTVVCPSGSTCYPLWEAYICKCGTGLALQNNVCVASCNPNPCLNFGVCSIAEGAAVCTCPDGWSGQYCNTQRQVNNVDNGGLGGGAIAGIVIAIIVLLILLILLLIFLFTRKRSEKEKFFEVDPDDDFIRENVVFYDEEGAGEEDHAAYDITLLQRPMKETFSKPMYSPPLESEIRRQNAPQVGLAPRADRPDVGTFIKDRINEAEKDDPLDDSTRAFNFEGGDSDAGSLSSLNTSSSGGSQDYDYLSSWGPKFAKLADMYGAGQSMDDV